MTVTEMAEQPEVPRACPVAASLQLLGERWTLLAIRELTYGVHRFDQIAHFTGASRDILTDRLRGLEEAGVVERRQYSERPPRFEYHLTPAGEELRPGAAGARRVGFALGAAAPDGDPGARLRSRARHRPGLPSLRRPDHQGQHPDSHQEAMS